MDKGMPYVGTKEAVTYDANATRVDDVAHPVDEVLTKVDELEQSDTPEGCSTMKDKDKQKHLATNRRWLRHASRRAAAAAKRLQELMCQFVTIFHMITMRKRGKLFMQPVDVVRRGLHEYREPMNFCKIKNKMEAKDDTGYKSIREVCADVRLIFKNTMKYNDERDDILMMAKTLLAKFEEKSLQLLPKVNEEEESEEGEAEAQLNMQLAQENTHAKMARDSNFKLDEVETHLEELREMVIRLFGEMVTYEKVTLGRALARLSPKDLYNALQIVVQNHPDFQLTTEEVHLDMDYLSDYTLWRLKFFVKDALRIKGESSAWI